jgi:hypothetical protein
MHIIVKQLTLSLIFIHQSVEKIKAANDKFSLGRGKLLAPVANLTGSTSTAGKEPKCILGGPGQVMKARSPLQVCKSSSLNFIHDNSKAFMLGRRSGFLRISTYASI